MPRQPLNSHSFVPIALILSCSTVSMHKPSFHLGALFDLGKVSSKPSQCLLTTMIALQQLSVVQHSRFCVLEAIIRFACKKLISDTMIMLINVGTV